MRTSSVYNCHVHLFTNRHVPAVLPLLRYVLGHGAFLDQVVKVPDRTMVTDQGLPDRLGRLLGHLYVDRQQTQLSRLTQCYGRNVHFAAMAVDMTHAGWGPVDVHVRAQHDELYQVASSPDSRTAVMPFMAVDPRRDRHELLGELEQRIDKNSFRGVKIYPSLGYHPADPVLQEVYGRLSTWNERNQRAPYKLAVMAHCSNVGVFENPFTRSDADRRRLADTLSGATMLQRPVDSRSADWLAALRDGSLVNVVRDVGDKLVSDILDRGLAGEVSRTMDLAAPENYEDLLRRYGNVNFCLAHFGGFSDEWRRSINAMMTGHENLWTDLSYTFARDNQFQKCVHLIKSHEHVSHRTLFGSDYFLTTQEKHGDETEVLSRLRDALQSERLFKKLTLQNPANFFGLQ
jgi:predicted TIM-barrel fold metal-dependent hydrolase